MHPANDNVHFRNLQVAIWKMRRAGLPSDVIRSALALTENQMADLQHTSTAPRLRSTVPDQTRLI